MKFGLISPSRALGRLLLAGGGWLYCGRLESTPVAPVQAGVQLLRSDFCHLGSNQEQDAKKLCMAPTGEMFTCDYIGFLTVLNAQGENLGYFSVPAGRNIALFESGDIGIGPIWNEGELFFVSDEGGIYCCEADALLNQRPAERWRAELLGPCNNEPAFQNQRLFIQDALQNVYAFQRLDGQLLWRRNLLEETPASGFFTGLKSNCVPVPVGQDALLALDSEGYLTLLNQATGERLDKELLFEVALYEEDPLSASVGGLARPQSHHNLLTFASSQGIVTLDTSLVGRNNRLNVVEVWRNSDPIWFDFVISGNDLYYTTLRGDLVCLHRRTGKERWRLNLTQHPQQLLGVPAVTESEPGEFWVLVSDAFGDIYGIHSASGELRFHQKGQQRLSFSDLIFGENPNHLYEKIFFSKVQADCFYTLTKKGRLCCWRWWPGEATPEARLTASSSHGN